MLKIFPAYLNLFVLALDGTLSVTQGCINVINKHSMCRNIGETDRNCFLLPTNCCNLMDAYTQLAVYVSITTEGVMFVTDPGFPLLLQTTINWILSLPDKADCVQGDSQDRFVAVCNKIPDLYSHLVLKFCYCNLYFFHGELF